MENVKTFIQRKPDVIEHLYLTLTYTLVSRSQEEIRKAELSLGTCLCVHNAAVLCHPSHVAIAVKKRISNLRDLHFRGRKTYTLNIYAKESSYGAKTSLRRSRHAWHLKSISTDPPSSLSAPHPKKAIIPKCVMRRPLLDEKDPDPEAHRLNRYLFEHRTSRAHLRIWLRIRKTWQTSILAQKW
ncbi:hypothetical protein M422DRAFT_240624 [Sphaerobolus stellatus SS14]|nr:hypothetical protein M422DRAFT_240624 [Sphaerobolus stellatus SS14]